MCGKKPTSQLQFKMQNIKNDTANDIMKCITLVVLHWIRSLGGLEHEHPVGLSGAPPLPLYCVPVQPHVPVAILLLPRGLQDGQQVAPFLGHGPDGLLSDDCLILPWIL